MTRAQQPLSAEATLSLRKAEPVSDEFLMQAYAEGDASALAFLIHRYERELYSYLRRLVVDACLAEDVFQNTFLQVHQKRHLYEFGRPFRPWLYTIATHQAIDALRRNQRHRRVSLDSESSSVSGKGGGALLDAVASDSRDPLDDCERKEKRELVREAVDTLAEHLRVVIVLGYYQGLKYKEIAEILGIPVGTVKSRLHAAIHRLGDRWRELGLGDE